MPPLTEADWARIIADWDANHPAEAEEEETTDEALEYDADAMALVPQIPTIDEIPEIVDYSVRAEGDWVISGPLVGGSGRGTVFDTMERAHLAACIKYGSKRVYPWDSGSEGRWALLIKKA